MVDGLFLYYGPEGKLIAGKYDEINNILVDTVLIMELVLPDGRIATTGTKQGVMLSKIDPLRMFMKVEKDTIYHETYYKTLTNINVVDGPTGGPAGKGLFDGRGRK